MLTPKERLKADEKHISINTEHAIKVAEKSLVRHFEQAMNAPKSQSKTQAFDSDNELNYTTNNMPQSQQNSSPQNTIQMQVKSKISELLRDESKPAVKTTADNATNTRASHSVIGHLMNTEEKPAQRVTNEKRHHNMAQESPPTPDKSKGISQPEPGRATDNIKTSNLINTQADTLVSPLGTQSASSLVERIQILAPNLANQNSVQLVSDPLRDESKPAVKTTADNATNTRASHSVIGHLMNTEEKPAQRVTNERRHHNMAQESTGTQNQGISQANNTPGNIILANMKTSEPINTHLHSLVSQLVERVQILVPNLAGQNKVQLILEQGKLKGTEITITLQNNQLTVTLAHNGQHTELLKKMYPELLERLQRLNTDQHVRIVTMNNEQNAQHSDREQGHQQESNQKSRILDYWLEDQENA